MAFSFFLNIFSRSRDIQVFVQKVMTSQIVSHKIKNILGNIEVMLLKLGTSNVPLVRHQTPFLFSLRGLSNNHKLFFTS